MANVSLCSSLFFFKSLILVSYGFVLSVLISLLNLNF